MLFGDKRFVSFVRLLFTFLLYSSDSLESDSLLLSGKVFPMRGLARVGLTHFDFDFFISIRFLGGDVNLIIFAVLMIGGCLR